MSNPYGVPSLPQQKKSRSPMYIALACGCAVLAALVVVGGGVGAWLLLREPDVQPPSEPTSEAPIDDPTEEPTEEPTDEPTDEPTAEDVASISVSAPEEGPTLDTESETLESENGKFVGVAIIIENTGTEDIGLDGDKFRFYDDAGQSYRLRYGSFSTSGPQVEPGETATAMLYVDVPADTVIESVSYTDSVGTGGEEIILPVG